MVGPFPRVLTRIDGGVAAATTYLAQALVELPGIELVGVRLTAGKRTQPSEADLGWPVVDLDLGRLSVSTLFRRQVRRFRQLVDRFRPDIIHAQGADAAGFVALKSGVPAVVTIHGILRECAAHRTSLVSRLREMLQAQITERYVVAHATHVISISPYVVGYFKSRLLAAIHDIPNPVSPAYFDLPRAPERGRFLFAGRISKGKGLSDLALAVAHLEGSSAVDTVVLAGASPEREYESRLRSDIDSLGIVRRFEFAGLLDENRLIEEFHRATALVLPSYQETAPMVVQQAMAAGLPVIATRVGGIPHMIDHEESGLLFEPGDALGLAGLLTRFAEDPGLGMRLSQAAKRVAAARFSAARVARATVDAYRQVLQAA
jgi:glycosyltransferase involved in cell wall biosynthesis